MRVAWVYAGLILNAGLLELLYSAGAWRRDWITTLVGTAAWGLFLVLGVYYAPARLGLPVRELVERMLGRWAGEFVWWVLLPFWLVNWFAFQMAWFLAGMRVGFLRDGEWWGGQLDNMLAIHWPWLILTALPGWSTVPVRVSAAVLLAAPFAFRPAWPEAVAFTGFDGVWEMQPIILWLAPALLWVGTIPGSKVRALPQGLVGIALPMIAASIVTALALTRQTASSSSVMASLAGPHVRIGMVRIFLLGITGVAAGRFCVACAGEYLGEWRRWWSVGLVTFAAMVWGAQYWPYELHWKQTATPFLPLAGVICAAYLLRREFVFRRAEQAAAVIAWLAGWAVNAPFMAWATAFVLTAVALWLMNRWLPHADDDGGGRPSPTAGVGPAAMRGDGERSFSTFRQWSK